MPKIGAEPERRQALIQAAIAMIGERGSLDVPVKAIAEHAGMSSALAFHYFGGKDEIVVETMRYLLRALSAEMIAGLRRAGTPLERIDAVICTSFAADQFDRRTIAAWLVFYLKAYSYPPAARLLSIYFRRLESNLLPPIAELLGDGAPRVAALQLADSLGALIDGLYIRQTLGGDAADAHYAVALCREHIAAVLNLRGVKLPDGFPPSAMPARH
ncbi:MAG: transcriptional regulator BetI [Nitratireductor sp.]|nr:transcriptional regulator BetI [Nitratireductor sp.]